MLKKHKLKNPQNPHQHPKKQRSKCAELSDFKQHQHLYLFSSDQLSEGSRRVLPKVDHHDVFTTLKCSFSRVVPNTDAAAAWGGSAGKRN